MNDERTDAEVWRLIAEASDGQPRSSAGLCECLTFTASNRTWWGRRYSQVPELGPWQRRRMEKALRQFRPRGTHNWMAWWGFDKEGSDQRHLAACFLAAMADADGGNHAE